MSAASPVLEQATNDHDRHFRTDHLMADLKGRSVRGGAITLAAQAVKFVLQLGSTVILARLLTPADFGLVAMVTAITGFVAMFKDLGLSQATVQRATINQQQVSTLFWINVALSAALMALVAGLSPLVAWFYGDDRLVGITLALAGEFIFGGLTVQHGALLTRQMRFRALAIIDILSFTAGVAAALGMAWMGLGYWALVGMPAGQAVANCLLVWIASGWTPGRPARGSGVREMLKFGGNLAGFNLVNYFSRNADNVLIGRFWGDAALGIYTWAYQLMMLPISHIAGPIQQVGVNTLSRLVSRPDDFARYYLQALNRICWATAPMVAILLVCAPEVVRILLGPGWESAARVFQILGITAFFQPIYTTIGWVFVSTGRTDRFLRWSLMAMPITVAGFVGGLRWGVEGVAWGYAIAFCVGVLPWTFPYTFRGTHLTVRAMVRHLAAPYAFAAVALISGFLIRPRIDHSAPVVLVATSLFGVLCAVAVTMVIAPMRRDAARLLNSLVSLLPSRPVIA